MTAYATIFCIVLALGALAYFFGMYLLNNFPNIHYHLYKTLPESTQASSLLLQYGNLVEHGEFAATKTPSGLAAVVYYGERYSNGTVCVTCAAAGINVSASSSQGPVNLSEEERRVLYRMHQMRQASYFTIAT